MTFHHIGCLTNNMENSIAMYREAMGFNNVSDVYFIKDQNVRVCFIETGPAVFLELVEPSGGNAALNKILKSNNPYYHIGYMVSNINEKIAQLQFANFHLVNIFNSEAFNNKLCAFLYSDSLHLIELIER
jgi:methylmalonyl-CoA/ethylmalonyl-CoA epimerase